MPSTFWPTALVLPPCPGHPLRKSAARQITSPARSRRCDELATSAPGMDALAGPGVITHDEYEDSGSENGVDEPAESRCRYVEHDSRSSAAAPGRRRYS